MFTAAAYRKTAPISWFTAAHVGETMSLCRHMIHYLGLHAAEANRKTSSISRMTSTPDGETLSLYCLQL